MSPPRIVMISRMPGAHALLVAVPEEWRAHILAPRFMAFCRVAAEPSGYRPDALARLFDLSPREAQLANLMCTGMTLGEAAAAMNLREGTARGYSKQIYAKMGVRGQADMVREIWLSEASLV